MTLRPILILLSDTQRIRGPGIESQSCLSLFLLLFYISIADSLKVHVLTSTAIGGQSPPPKASLIITRKYGKIQSGQKLSAQPARPVKICLDFMEIVIPNDPLKKIGHDANFIS